MESVNRSKIIADFFLDGAKILFGSLVVGAFIPGAVGEQPPYFTITSGIIFTVIFLVIADALARRGEIA